MNAVLALENGTVFRGKSVGAAGEASGEVVFNTSMTGYQEVLTDPSYSGQIVTMTTPEIGNYGVTSEDVESRGVQVAGFVIRDESPVASNWRSEGTLRDYLTAAGIVAIADVDTRALTRVLRSSGVMRGVIGTGRVDPDDLVARARAIPMMEGADLVKDVTCLTPFDYQPPAGDAFMVPPGRRSGRPLRVAAYDYGMKWNILRRFAAYGCTVKVYPAVTPIGTLLADQPDGVFLSNGPGDPAVLDYAIASARELVQSGTPTFGICLGHQVLGLAMGARTFKLKFGHRGANHPVKELRSGKIEITSQNHGFAVDPGSLPHDVEVTHLNLYDGTIEGLRHATQPVFCVQYHPEAAPGPHDADYLFDQFLDAMEKRAQPLMPKRSDLKRILVIGSGPIVIGQACEFDYSGTQACKALRDEGLEVVLVNSNPATIMTDPEIADRTYVEPLTVEVLEQIIAHERPDALLPTVGGQTALNLAVELAERGVLEKYHVALIGASIAAIKVAEDRQQFKDAMRSIGIDVPESAVVRAFDEALVVADRIGYPLIIRPSFTMGGIGGGIAYNVEEFKEICGRGLSLSPVHEVLVEQSVIGWKEFELEVMRDGADNFVVICSIENIDPMGVHTGDSITVAPALTLSDKEYQRMRDAARRIIRRVGVETGGSNIQFAINPADGHMVAIEMNPRVSRSSALASKATGFPIAKIAAKLALGYRLDEIPNDITRLTPASFEPSIDYVVVKVPRWAFEKFPQADRTLTTQMKSVGEAMAIGRTFKEAFLKAFRSLELGKSGRLFGQGAPGGPFAGEDDAALQQALGIPTDLRMWAVFRALERGWSLEEIHRLTHIDPWFLTQFQQIVDAARAAQAVGARDLSDDLLIELKRTGFADADLARIIGMDEDGLRARRQDAGIVAAYKRIDTCAAEFESFTPYMYGTYEKECEAAPTSRNKVVILGSGPNRIGQGIEFDYCCCHAAFALRDEGYETVMVNCNPETVSTDYDTVDRLYFEPLTFEDVFAVIERERSAGGDVACVVQYGGQTPLKLSLRLQAAGVRIVGTSPDSIDLAEDRERFSKLLWDLGIPQAPSGMATSADEARAVAASIGFPVVVRPSYVLGGRAMAIVYDTAALDRYMRHAVQASPEHPILVDKFIEDATEIDVDALADASGGVVIGGIMEHIEQAGIHSGDSSCVVPPFQLSAKHIATVRDYTRRIAQALNVIGLMNIQFAVKEDVVYVLEVNPRASRTVPFLSKATGVPLAKIAAKLMVGRTLAELGLTADLEVPGFFVKTPVFPFVRFPGVDTLLGPEMKSTGEVMGCAATFGSAFAKAMMGAGQNLPQGGTAFISVNNRDKAAVVPIASELARLGFRLLATRGTAAYLRAHGLDANIIFKINEGRPHVGDELRNKHISLVINTPLGRESFFDDRTVRSVAMMQGVPAITTLTGAAAAVSAIAALRSEGLTVRALQDW